MIRKGNPVNNLRSRVFRLAATSVLALGLGALGAGPALASYNSWAGSVPNSSHHGIHAVEDESSPEYCRIGSYDLCNY